MPELPEVETTTNDLRELLVGLEVKGAWTDYDSPHYYGKNQIKNPKFFKKFKEQVSGAKVIGTSRRAKNVLIHLDNNRTILVHLKMTGHLLFGEYKKIKSEWKPVLKDGPLNDPFNGWIHFVLEFSNKTHLALSDMRKFAKVTLLDSDKILISDDLVKLGPEILELNFEQFRDQISNKSTGKIKTVLMNQELLAGIGNIYSDEALWLSKIHPEKVVGKIDVKILRELFKNIKKVLEKGIDFKGDSMSDYRRPSGLPGDFQNHHMVYQRKKEGCKRRGCSGEIKRIVVGGRSAHFCPVCQI